MIRASGVAVVVIDHELAGQGGRTGRLIVVASGERGGRWWAAWPDELEERTTGATGPVTSTASAGRVG